MTKSKSPWYEEFFRDDYVKTYGHLLTEERAAVEVAFIERILGLKPEDKILDLCCGLGRHSLLLAERGYHVTAQDLNKDYLDQLDHMARARGLTLQSINSDMRVIPFEAHFDAVINMFTSFGYLESEDDDMVVLNEVSKALKPGGRFLLDNRNREWVVSNYIQNEWRQAEDGSMYLEHREIDLVTSRVHVTFTIVEPDGSKRHSVGHHVRLYTLTETKRMMEKAGLRFESVYGGFNDEPYSVSSRRMIVAASRDG